MLSNATNQPKSTVELMCDYQESVTTGQTHGQIDTRQSDPYVPLCFAGDTIKICQSVHVLK